MARVARSGTPSPTPIPAAAPTDTPEQLCFEHEVVVSLADPEATDPEAAVETDIGVPKAKFLMVTAVLSLQQLGPPPFRQQNVLVVGSQGYPFQ